MIRNMICYVAAKDIRTGQNVIFSGKGVQLRFEKPITAITITKDDVRALVGGYDDKDLRDDTS